jgi:aerobic carbon-monoxide dehydrogenase medium subunit
MKAGKLQYHRATSLHEAIELSKSHENNARYLSGGQSLMPMMNLRMMLSSEIVDLSQIFDLKETYFIGNQYFIGACITHAMIEDSRIKDSTQGYMPFVASGIAYRSIRNKGTIGGSLVNADPAADWPTALLALNAIAVIQAAGEDYQIPLSEFQRGLMQTALNDGDILKGVLIPQLSNKSKWSYVKFCHKVGEFAHSIVAIVDDRELGINNVVLGSAAEKPILLPRVSQLLQKGITLHDVSNQLLEEFSADDILQYTDHHKTSYEFHLHQSMIKKALIEVLKK